MIIKKFNEYHVFRTKFFVAEKFYYIAQTQQKNTFLNFDQIARPECPVMSK